MLILQKSCLFNVYVIKLIIIPSFIFTLTFQRLHLNDRCSFSSKLSHKNTLLKNIKIRKNFHFEYLTVFIKLKKEL